jgi:two-component system phosphate regulon sensor histidine kinase PhoR
MKNANMRQEFTANVSHELKTPLTSISGYSELIESGIADDEDVVRFARQIHKNSNRLLTLINDIIRLSELDHTATEENHEQVDLYETAKTCVELLKMNAGKNDVTLQLHGESHMAYANKQMMEELIFNLCDNAIRYNNPGGAVDITVSGNESNTVVEVKDTGIGIPKEHQERIFERFYRVDKSRSKSTGGTGLGLAIVKHILAKHENTRLELESEVGKGTCVRVIFSTGTVNIQS